MKEEFEFWEGISASMTNSTRGSGIYYLFAYCLNDRSVSCEAGSIDVHYPCLGMHKLEATITIDLEVLSDYGLILPPCDVLVERLLTACNFVKNESYLVKFCNVTGSDIYDSIVISQKQS